MQSDWLLISRRACASSLPLGRAPKAPLALLPTAQAICAACWQIVGESCALEYPCLLSFQIWACPEPSRILKTCIYWFHIAEVRWKIPKVSSQISQRHDSVLFLGEVKYCGQKNGQRLLWSYGLRAPVTLLIHSEEATMDGQWYWQYTTSRWSSWDGFCVLHHGIWNPGFRGAGPLRSGRFVHLGCGPYKIVKPNDDVDVSNSSVPFLPLADVRDFYRLARKHSRQGRMIIGSKPPPLGSWRSNNQDQLR